MSKTPETDRFYSSFADGVAIPNQEEWLDHCRSIETQLSEVNERNKKVREQILGLTIDGIDNFSKGRNATIDAVIALIDNAPEVDPIRERCLEQGYIPEVWPMLKDWIYDAQLAIDTGIENSEELLLDRDERLGRTVRSNRLVSERMEHEIQQMKKALRNIKHPYQPEGKEGGK